MHFSPFLSFFPKLIVSSSLLSIRHLLSIFLLQKDKNSNQSLSYAIVISFIYNILLFVFHNIFHCLYFIRLLCFRLLSDICVISLFMNCSYIRESIFPLSYSWKCYFVHFWQQWWPIFHPMYHFFLISLFSRIFQ